MVEIGDIFLKHRFPNGWKLLPLLVYYPIGLVVATVRVFIGLQAILAASLLHKLATVRAVTLRIMCGILGLVVTQENSHLRDESVKVLVSNRVTILDHLAIHLLTGSISVSAWDLPSFFHFAFNYIDLGSFRDKEMLTKNVKSFLNSKEAAPVDVQPEEAITSGKIALMKFSSWSSSLTQPIQPVAIRVWRPPLMEVAPSVLSATWFSDFFWFLFVPCSVFTIKYLPVVQRLENETEEEMTRRLEKVIANELELETTALSGSDKSEYEKRLVTEQNAPRVVRRLLQADPVVLEMATRVKEVLPNVPFKVICSDLVKTRSVDATISNLLEGLISYVPEPVVAVPTSKSPPTTAKKESKSSLESQVSAPSCSSNSSSSSSISLDTSAKTFHKSAQDRMLSFQERKQRLIDSARQRYIEKHALSIINNS